ncbi:MAG: FAD-binding oxidoreductase [Nitrospiraceae bacterium]
MAVTKKLDLRTGRSVWQVGRRPRLPTSLLRRDLKPDVVIVGAGISGAMIADALTDAGFDVAIVDRRGPLRGSTPASTALLQYELDVPLIHLAKRIGRTRAERLWRRARLAVNALSERTAYLGIEADLAQRDALALDGDVLDVDELQVEAEARRRAGFEVSYLAPREVQRRYGIRRRAAILGHGNIIADPSRMAAGFLRAALSRGAQLFAPVEVTDVSTLTQSVSVTTKQGPCIRAKHVIFATGYKMPTIVPTKGHRIISTWAIATRPQRRRLWPEEVLIWEASDPYLYLRPGPGGCVICGGEDETFTDEEARDALLQHKTAVLERKLARLFPYLDPRAAYAWTGSFGASPTGTPSIGPIPGKRHCYAALGYGGNGIVFSMMAAQLLRGLITGVGDPDFDLVSFSRTF